ncbi:MAG: type IV secretory system conjugative DNA transfer family protein [Candidatus Altimarinota bacterium]
MQLSLLQIGWIVIGILLGIYVLTIVLELLARKAEQNSEQKEENMVISVRVAKDNETSPLVAEQIFATLHSVVSKISFLDRLKGVTEERISFEIANINRSIKFYVCFPAKLKNLVEGQIYAQYPHVEIEEVKDYAFGQSAEVSGGLPKGQTEGRELTVAGKATVADQQFKKVDLFANAVGMELALSEPDFLPIKQYGQYEDKSVGMNVDPLSSITSTMAKFNSDDEQAWIQLVISPIPEKQKDHFLKIYQSMSSSKIFGKFIYKFFWKSSALKRKVLFPLAWIFKPKNRVLAEGVKPSDKDAAVDAKLGELLYAANLRIVYVPKQKNQAAIVKLKEIAGSFKQFNLTNLNGFAIAKTYQDSSVVEKFRKRTLETPFILNVKELATVYHLPNNTVQTPNIYWVRSKKIEPPNDLPIVSEEPEAPVTAIGKSNFRGVDQKFGIKTLDRRRHMYIIGKTGMGKSVLLENMLFSDIQAGRGVAVVDPHGDLAEAVINFVPSWRTNDVIIVDPSDREFPIAFNMLENVDPSLNTIITSGLVGIFKKIYADSWGPRLEHILRNTILSLLEYPNTTMLGIPRILQDADFRRKVIRKIQDPLVRSFWLNEFEKMDPKQRVEAISPILNKVGQFLSSPIIRNILGQVQSKIDFRFAMDNKKIVIVNLSKGKIGEDNSSLLGSMIITKFQIDAMSRANQAEKDRVDFYLYVDEFQNFATDSFATILSEARKYKLNLTMANQYIAQMPEEVRDAVFGNVGSILSFQVGFDDAEYLSQQYGEEALPADLVNLSKYTAYMRLLNDGMPSKTFSLDTLPPPQFEVEPGRREKVIKLARERYCTPREIVEDKINRWSRGVDVDEDLLSDGSSDKEKIAAPKKAELVKPAVKSIKPPSDKPKQK